MATRKVIRGDSDSFKITFVSSSTNSRGAEVQTPINICGWDIRFTVRKDIAGTNVSTDATAVIHKVAEILDASKGIAYIHLSSKDTNIDPGEYWYDIQYVCPVDCKGETKVKSIPKSKFIVLEDVTRNQKGY